MRSTILTLLACLPLVATGETQPASLQPAIQKGLDLFIPHVLQRRDTPQGVTLQDFKAGSPVPVYILTQDVISNYTVTKTVTNLAVFAYAWRVPVSLQGRAIGFLEVGMDESNQCSATAFGFQPMAVAWAKVCEAWPAPKYHPMLLQAECRMDVLYTVPEVSASNLTFLGPYFNADGHLANGYDVKALTEAKDIMPRIAGFYHGAR